MQIVKKVFSCEGFAAAFPKLLGMFSWFILGLIIGNYFGKKNCKNKSKKTQDKTIK